MAQNKNVIYALSGVAAALLVALVGVVAYNMGKDKSDENDYSNTNTLVESSSSNTSAQASSMVTDSARDVANTTEDLPEEEPVDALAMTEWHLTGTIAGQGVVMDLNNDGDKVWGSYYYTRVGSPLELNGTIDKYGNIFIEEYNARKDHYSGEMNVKMSRSGHLTGSHYNYDRGATTRVNLSL